MSEDCKRHDYIYTHEGNAHHTVYHYHSDDCPFCKIDRLKAELEEAKLANLAIRSERDQAVARLHVDLEVSKHEIDTLTNQLAEARAEVTRYRSGIEIDGYVRNDCGSHWIESAYLGSDTEFANDMSVRVLII